MNKLKVNDEVMVTTGKDAGKLGKIKKINWKQSKVYVTGVNMVKKTVKATQQNPAGGITNVEAAIHISNVSLLSPKTKKPTRVKIEVRDGKPVRISKKCGSVIE